MQPVHNVQLVEGGQYLVEVKEGKKY